MDAKSAHTAGQKKDIHNIGSQHCWPIWLSPIDSLTANIIITSITSLTSFIAMYAPVSMLTAVYTLPNMPSPNVQVHQRTVVYQPTNHYILYTSLYGIRDQTPMLIHCWCLLQSTEFVILWNFLQENKVWKQNIGMKSKNNEIMQHFRGGEKGRQAMWGLSFMLHHWSSVRRAIVLSELIWSLAIFCTRSKTVELSA